MKRPWQFISVCVVAVVVSSALSHAAVRLFKIKAAAEQYAVFGSKVGKPVAMWYGTSPAYDGLDWNQAADLLGGGMASWGITGSSASEWEIMQLRAPDATRTFIVVTPADLNDYWLCDFRAQIVPFWKTIQDLRQAGADGAFSRRMLSQYPLTYIRKLFPTAGRSDGVMVGIRRVLQSVTGRSSSHDDATLPQLRLNGVNMVKEKLTDWDPAREQRRLALIRAACEGKQWFGGPKKLALIRMVQLAAAHGKVTIVVLPLSPIYQREFLTPQAVRDLERTLEEVQASGANTPMIRLDKLEALHNNDVFWDFVHMNMEGQKIATAAFLKEIKAP